MYLDKHLFRFPSSGYDLFLPQPEVAEVLSALLEKKKKANSSPHCVTSCNKVLLPPYSDTHRNFGPDKANDNRPDNTSCLHGKIHQGICIFTAELLCPRSTIKHTQHIQGTGSSINRITPYQTLHAMSPSCSVSRKSFRPKESS